MQASVLEDVNRAESIVGDVKAGIRVTRDDRRLRTGIANQVDASRQILQIFWISHVAMEERGAMMREYRDVPFAATTHQIIHYRNRVTLRA